MNDIKSQLDEKANTEHGVHVTTASVKNALGTSNGTTKFLREDGTWAAPPTGDGSGGVTDYYDLTNVPELEMGTQDFWLNSRGLHRIHRKETTKVTDSAINGVTNYITDDITLPLTSWGPLVEFFRDNVFERQSKGINVSNEFIVSPSSGRGRFLLDSTVGDTQFKQKNLLEAIATTINRDIGDEE